MVCPYSAREVISYSTGVGFTYRTRPTILPAPARAPELARLLRDAAWSVPLIAGVLAGAGRQPAEFAGMLRTALDVGPPVLATFLRDAGVSMEMPGFADLLLGTIEGSGSIYAGAAEFDDALRASGFAAPELADMLSSAGFTARTFAAMARNALLNVRAFLDVLRGETVYDVAYAAPEFDTALESAGFSREALETMLDDGGYTPTSFADAVDSFGFSVARFDAMLATFSTSPGTPTPESRRLDFGAALAAAGFNAAIVAAIDSDYIADLSYDPASTNAAKVTRIAAEGFVPNVFWYSQPTHIDDLAGHDPNFVWSGVDRIAAVAQHEIVLPPAAVIRGARAAYLADSEAHGTSRSAGVISCALLRIALGMGIPGELPVVDTDITAAVLAELEGST